MHERKHARRRMLIALALFMALGLSADGLLLAEAEPEPREIPAAQEEAPPEKAPPEKQADEQDEPQEPERLPLNLRNAGIDQIIQFLSEHTGKVILKSKDVQAQINLSSPEPVTPERAIELIFNALRLEGVAVVEREGVIHLLPEEKAAELGLEQRVLDIKFADVAEVEELVKPLLGDKTKLVADPRSNKVIVSGPAEKIAELADLVAQIDVLEIEGTQVHIFQLEHAEAEELAAILKAVLADDGGGGAERPGGPPGAGGASVAVVAYPSANWIVVRAPKDKLEAAKALVEELDREKPPELELSVVAVEHADAAELARHISELFAKRRRTEDVSDQVELTADERSNALIVLSTQANYELIKELVSKLDTEESRATETRSYVLQYADAEDVAQQLNDLYGGQQRTYYPWYYGGQQEPQTQFVAERRTNSLIVIAPPADFEQMEALIEKLDQPIDTAEVAPRIYHIENMDAKEMTDVLNQIFGTEEEQQQSGYWYYYSRRYQQEDQIGRLYGKVRFVHEPSTNSIIVITNNAENFRIIEELLERLDRRSRKRSPVHDGGKGRNPSVSGRTASGCT
ncbi:MAG: secretin N-terminal domain-containing protein, partial [Candidatus Brocadiia bacterium]